MLWTTWLGIFCILAGLGSVTVVILLWVGVIHSNRKTPLIPSGALPVKTNAASRSALVYQRQDV